MTMSYDKFKEVKVEKQEGVLTVILGQGPDVNRLHELNEIWESIPDDPEVRAVILTADGPDFTEVHPAGFSHHNTRKQPPHPLQNLELAGRTIHEGNAYHMIVIKKLLEVPQPIIAAVQGRCQGLGANIALHCDIVIAGDDSQISDAHIRSMVPGDGSCVIWPLLIGPNRAKQYLLTGDTVSAIEAERIGLVNRVVPVAELRDTAWALAKRLSNDYPPLAIRFTKHAINRVIAHQMDLVWELADAYQVFSTLTEDNQEAKRARAENRPPRFTGR
ncbi:enoyl-CoA hydratase/isomerase family protein [Chloroflexota bacterium]